jgi:hypothetical protein
MFVLHGGQSSCSFAVLVFVELSVFAPGGGGGRADRHVLCYLVFVNRSDSFSIELCIFVFVSLICRLSLLILNMLYFFNVLGVFLFYVFL